MQYDNVVMRLNRLNGRQRVGIALSILWVVFAVVAYFSSLGSYDITNKSVIDQLGVMGILELFVGRIGLGSLFNDHDAISSFFRGGSVIIGFDGVGFLEFLILPIGALWGLVYLVSWVIAGFHVDRNMRS